MRKIITAIILCAAAFSPAVPAWTDPAPLPHNNVRTVNRAFAPGEKLTYKVSWSTIIDAGIAVMEVRAGKTNDGRPTYELVSTTHSVGVLELAYPVRDQVTSIVDAGELYSLSFDLREHHGKKKRSRHMDFDPVKGTARDVVNEDPPETFPVPPRIQDALSSLYYVRTLPEFTSGKAIVVDVHDSGKNWAVEIQVLGKERISTPAGEFNTIKVKTYPRYEGVFTNKGEIYIWFTDDERKIPVLMKSEISIGSIVATLTEMQGVVNKS